MTSGLHFELLTIWMTWLMKKREEPMGVLISWLTVDVKFSVCCERRNCSYRYFVSKLVLIFLVASFMKITVASLPKYLYCLTLIEKNLFYKSSRYVSLH